MSLLNFPAVNLLKNSQNFEKTNKTSFFWTPTTVQLPFPNPLFIFLRCKYIHSELLAPKGAVRVLCSGCNPQSSGAVRAYVRPSVRVRDRPHNCAPTKRPVTDSMLQSTLLLLLLLLLLPSPSSSSSTGPPPSEKKIIWLKVNNSQEMTPPPFQSWTPFSK